MKYYDIKVSGTTAILDGKVTIKFQSTKQCKDFKNHYAEMIDLIDLLKYELSQQEQHNIDFTEMF